jgi:hypothetical protein
VSANGLIWATEHYLWCKNPGEFAVLVAIANYVGKDLCGCFAKQATLAERARCNPKTLRTHVHALAEKKVIVTGDSKLVAHLRADARPDVWDLNSDLPPDPATGNFYPPRGVKTPGREGSNLPSRPVKITRATGKNYRAEPGSDPGSETSSAAHASADASATGGGGGQHTEEQAPAAALVAGLDYLGQRPSNTENDLSSTSGGDLSSMTERPDVHDQTDLSSTSGKEVVEEVGKKTSPAGKPAPARKPPAEKSTEHQVADGLTAGFWERYGDAKLQEFIAVRQIVRRAITKGIDRDTLAFALDRVGQGGKPVSNGTLEFAMGQRSQEQAKQSRGGARSDTSTTNKELNL